MSAAGDTPRPVEARALLVDPVSLVVVWMNEAAAAALPDPTQAPAAGVSISSVVPAAERLRIADVVREVALSGEPRHVETDLVASAKGSLTIAISVYRIPSGQVLVIMDNAFSVSGRRASGERRRPSSR